MNFDDDRVEKCENCGHSYSGQHEGIDNILLFGSCCECFKATKEQVQQVKIHNFNRVDRGRTDAECKQRVDDFMNDPDRKGTRTWVINGIGCGGSCGGCSGCH
jgi:protein-arginine kinase activator protein McsA